MSTAILTASNAPKWIISQRDDLFWFIGSTLAGYISLAIIVGATSRAGLLSLAWWALINNPHIFGTATRTYFDKHERQRLSKLLWMIIPLSLIPVLITAVGFAKPLFVFAMTWGSWHVAKQHFGIAMIYKRKNGERSDVTLDKFFILVSLMLPLVLFIVWYVSIPVWELFRVFLVVQLVLVVLYIAHQVRKYSRHEEMNWPKLFLLLLVIPLHWLAFVAALQNNLNGIFVFSIATNIGHALQYHRLTWFHNRNRYQGKSGLSGIFSRSFIYYYAAGFGLYLIFMVVGGLLPEGGAELVLMGPTFMHYLLDTKIWRVRGDKELAHALNLN